ncbi:ATPase [Salmonirosea aquatica]|uniref:ATPase n=1 Tax=Salmonirosea aquatica TaxID=2654236 RepID=A0A7C9BJC3_9BACT|nr:ATPase [Cytophagaceae bacterium SJW1-29]
MARTAKGLSLYKAAYARKVTADHEYPAIDAESFADFIVARGSARLLDRGDEQPYAVDADIRSAFNLLCLYFTSDPRFEQAGFKLRKGIMLTGPRGCGKTWLMELCSFNPKGPYSVHVCQNIVDEFLAKDNAMSTLGKYSSNRPVDAPSHWGHSIAGRFFDDLGDESRAVSYGNERNVMEDILMERYRSVPHHTTHVTSNLTLDQLTEFYGGRLVDRLREMFNIIEFPPTAQSRRK